MVSFRSRTLRSKLWRLLAVLFAFALVAAACGDDDDDPVIGGDNGDDVEPASGPIEAVEPFFPKDADGNETLPCGGYGFRLENKDFRDAFNDQLAALQADGTVEDLILAYEDFDPDDVRSAQDLTVADFAPNAPEGETGGGLLESLQGGTITIGIANEAPFGFVGDDGEPAGAAPDVAQLILAELGIENVEAQVVEFGQLIGGLQARQFDMIAAGMYINEERAEQILFSDPDYCIRESLAVAAGNPHGIVDYQSIVDNPELTLAVATGTVEVGYAEDAGVPDNQLRVFADIDSMYDALVAGEVDAVTGTAATVALQVAARS